MSISDRLDQITARAETVVGLTLGDDNARDAYNLVEDAVPDLVAAVRAVLDLHRESSAPYDTGYCEGCNQAQEFPEDWPCPTVRAIATALGEETP